MYNPMHHYIKIGVGGYMATSLLKNSPAKIKNAQAVYQLPAAIPEEYLELWASREDG